MLIRLLVAVGTRAAPGDGRRGHCPPGARPMSIRLTADLREWQRPFELQRDACAWLLPCVLRRGVCALWQPSYQPADA